MSRFRYPGEFEYQDSVMITWPKNVFSAKGYNVYQVFNEIVMHLIEHVKIIINCSTLEGLNKCKQSLTEADINYSDIEFTSYPDDLNWARDYGADIMINKDQLQAIDFQFNTYGLEEVDSSCNQKNQLFALKHAKGLKCHNVLKSKLVTEGGNKEFNGSGIMMSIVDTEKTKRNPNYSLSTIESIYKYLFNLKKIIWIKKGSYEDEDFFDGVLYYEDQTPVYRSLSANGHIDEMCRFVSENKILLAEVDFSPTNEAEKITKQRLEEAHSLLSKERNHNDALFEIVRMPVPLPFSIEIDEEDEIYQIWEFYKNKSGMKVMRDRTPFPDKKFRVQPAMSYCNFLISNGVVLGQKYYKEGMSLAIKDQDDKAKKVLEGIFPDRKVITINSTALNILGGGIHCVTKNVAKRV
ncbi:MAG: agmatine deiminase family protein [Clostridiales bacterium]|nr:agmatine deiminase family protein [Clostridiales bacterium]